MDKDSILAKAQNEKDEMAVHTRDKTVKYTYLAKQKNITTVLWLSLLL